MQLLQPIKEFFTRRRLNREAEVIDEVEDPVEVLLKAYRLFDDLDLSRYRVRNAVSRTVVTCAPDVDHLNQWLEWAWVTISSNEYVPDKWKVLKHTATERPLDDFMSIKGIDVDPVAFLQRSGERIRFITNALLSTPDNETEIPKLRYYRRQYSSLINDCAAVLKTLFEVINQ